MIGNLNTCPILIGKSFRNKTPLSVSTSKKMKHKLKIILSINRPFWRIKLCYLFQSRKLNNTVHIFSFIALFTGYTGSSQVIPPYHMPFNIQESANTFFWGNHKSDTSNFWDMESSFGNGGGAPDNPTRVSFITDSVRSQNSNQVVKLVTLNQNDKIGGIPATSKRSRTEIKIYPSHSEGSEFYYAWSFKIPTDDYIDDINENIIAQWHEPPGLKFKQPLAQPPFFLILKDDTLSNSLSRKINFMYGIRYDEDGDGKPREGKYHSYPIGEIVKGEWYDVIQHIRWSTNPDIGYLEMWINNQKVNYEGADKFYAANLYETIEGEIVPNYFKLGLYRQGANTRQSILIDEFRIGNTFQEVNLRTDFKSFDTTRQLDSLDTKIYCHEVYGAESYHFYLIDQDTTIVTDRPFINLSEHLEITSNLDSIRMKCRVGLYSIDDTFSLYGNSCLFFLNKY